MKRMVSGLLLFIILSLTACTKKPPREGGVSISFDDRSVSDWFKLKDLFLKYEAKVTFFVTQFDSLDSTEIKMLRELESDGHEIGSHGAMHVMSEKYIKEHSYSDYLADEIERSVSEMERSGFYPQSFAYPYGAKYWLTDLLLSQKFKVIRGVEPFTSGDAKSLDNIFHKFDVGRTVSALSMDKNSRLDHEMVCNLLSRAKVNHETLLLFAHAPTSEQNDSAYTFDVDFLEFILREASNKNLKFYTIQQLVD
jgi:peptidoglycan/xylan/chitin deacetylase (PgdA/CDA1 family)